MGGKISFVEDLRKLDPEVAKRFEEVKIEDIEVPNAPAYADYFVSGARYGFCYTVNNPCDRTTEDLIIWELIEAFTGWRIGYFFLVMEQGGWKDEPEKTIQEIAEKLYNDEYDEDPKTIYMSLIASLYGAKYVLLLDEDNFDWNEFAIYEALHEFDRDIEQIFNYMGYWEKKMEETEDPNEREHAEQCYFEPDDDCIEEAFSQ